MFSASSLDAQDPTPAGHRTKTISIQCEVLVSARSMYRQDLMKSLPMKQEPGAEPAKSPLSAHPLGRCPCLSRKAPIGPGSALTRPPSDHHVDCAGIHDTIAFGKPPGGSRVQQTGNRVVGDAFSERNRAVSDVVRRLCLPIGVSHRTHNRSLKCSWRGCPILECGSARAEADRRMGHGSHDERSRIRGDPSPTLASRAAVAARKARMRHPSSVCQTRTIGAPHCTLNRSLTCSWHWPTVGNSPRRAIAF